MRRYDAEIKLINYLMSHCVEDDDFYMMSRMKKKVIVKANEEYLSKEEFKENNLPKGLSKKLELGLSLESFYEKMKREEVPE